MVAEDKTEILTGEQETTVRFQLAYGVGMIIVSLVTFWIVSNVFTVDIKYAVLAIGAIVALAWMRDGLMILADVFINILKMRKGKE